MSKKYKECSEADKCHDSSTFGMDMPDPCRPMSTRQFRDLVNARVRCTGDYCVDGTFKCNVGATADCYHVEHILDENGPEYVSSKFQVGAKSGKDCGPAPRSTSKCSASIKNIKANYVMAWGKWNQGLPSEYGLSGGADAAQRERYLEMMREKEAIYGEDRVERARAKVLRCFKSAPFATEEEP